MGQLDPEPPVGPHSPPDPLPLLTQWGPSHKHLGPKNPTRRNGGMDMFSSLPLQWEAGAGWNPAVSGDHGKQDCGRQMPHGCRGGDAFPPPPPTGRCEPCKPQLPELRGRCKNISDLHPQGFGMPTCSKPDGILLPMDICLLTDKGRPPGTRISG